MKRAFPALLLSTFLLRAGLGAEEAPAAPGVPSDVIELPKFVVTDSRELPPPESWKYGTIPGFEILSNASERATKRLIDDFQLFREALSYVWQTSPRATAPIPLIVCGRGGKFDQFVPPKSEAGPEVARASLFLHDHDHSAIVIDFEAKTLDILSLDTDDPASGTDSSRLDIDHNKQLYREYVRFILSQSEPRLPAWFEEGISQIVMAMQFDRRSIIIGRLEDPNTVSAQAGMVAQINAAGGGGDGGAGDALLPGAPAEDRDFNAALQRRALIPLAKFFAVTHDAPEAQNPLGNNVWAKQAYAFVHLCIYGDNGKWQKPFAMLITRLAKEPMSEALFQECFKKNYKDFLLYLKGYIDFTNYQSKEFYAKRGQPGLDQPPPLQLRDATQSEVGRLKGEAMILAGRKDEAKREFIAPYIRGERDPRLLATLGMFDRANGDPARGRKLIEAAVAQKVDLSEAYLELAKVRYAEAMEKLPAPNATLSAAQTSPIVSLLMSARKQPPPISTTYELLADTWIHSAAKPTKDDLRVLVEGVQLYPGHLRLVYETAALCADNGVLDAAHQLADYGMKRAPEGAARERFAKLKAALPPLPPTAIPAGTPSAPQPSTARPAK